MRITYKIVIVLIMFLFILLVLLVTQGEALARLTEQIKLVLR